jgi:class 3 adenylate cyclase
MGYLSIIISADTIIAVVIYIIPKFLESGEDIDVEIMPDIFPNTTIMLADVEGFVAWSLVHEPLQVFKILESLYKSLDKIADRHTVFKVETVCDCYGKSTAINLLLLTWRDACLTISILLGS